MRQNNRERILAAIVRLVEREGVTAVTFDAVASESGITRAGIIYHFRSRDELIFAVHTHLAKQWEAQLEEIAPAPSTPSERHAAYILASSREASRADMLLMLDGLGNDRLAAIWQPLIDRWAPPVPADDDPAAHSSFLARLAADGLWAHQAMGGRAIPPELKAQVLTAMLRMHAHPSG